MFDYDYQTDLNDKRPNDLNAERIQNREIEIKRFERNIDENQRPETTPIHNNTFRPNEGNVSEAPEETTIRKITLTPNDGNGSERPETTTIHQDTLKLILTREGGAPWKGFMYLC